MKRLGIMVTLLVLSLFALPTLADSCSEEKAALQRAGQALQLEINQYNKECGGAHSRSEYESLRVKCEPWSARIDARNAELNKQASALAKRCN